MKPAVLLTFALCTTTAIADDLCPFETALDDSAVLVAWTTNDNRPLENQSIHEWVNEFNKIPE